MMLAGILLGFGIGVLLFIWMASSQRLTDWRKDKPEDDAAALPSWGERPWEELTERAQRVVEAAQAELPDDVRAEAVQVPTLFEEWHPQRERVLGIYQNFHTVELKERKGPIVLYLRAIEFWCRRTRRSFEDQVRGTYLHELGHHVGWNEGQVQERGL
jgi:predicted Zn-dependent protease with MMP-like domain